MMHLRRYCVVTRVACSVFAIVWMGSGVTANTVAEDHYRLARGYMEEAKQTSNAVRLLYLGWMIGEELENAVRLDPAMVDARLDLVRFYVMAPRIVGGGVPKARRQAREIARRSPALGAFAWGYIEYR